MSKMKKRALKAAIGKEKGLISEGPDQTTLKDSLGHLWVTISYVCALLWPSTNIDLMHTGCMRLHT